MQRRGNNWTSQEWIEELDFVARTDALAPGNSFLNEPSTFAEYCNMQANVCDVDGFHLIAEEIRQRRDIAWPTFRSDKRRLGWSIVGTAAYPRA